MTVRSSRTYKLKLSSHGIALFLQCHCRLCHLVEDMLPYGVTLHVAVRLLEQGPLDELIGDVLSPDILSFGGQEIRFVGTSPDLAEATRRITLRLAGAQSLYPLPQTWKLYLAALLCFRCCEDGRLVRAYEDVSGHNGPRP